MRIKKGISVIVTVFNKEKFIEKTILCILKQMKKNYQLIIVNDGSTDNSSKLIKKIIKNRKFDIRYIKKKNSGPSISINIALKYVKYSYIKLRDFIVMCLRLMNFNTIIITNNHTILNFTRRSFKFNNFW